MSALDMKVRVEATDKTIKELADMWTGFLDYPVLPEHVRPMLAMLLFVDGVHVGQASNQAPAISVGKASKTSKVIDAAYPAIHFTDEELKEDWLIAGEKVRLMAKKARAFEELYERVLLLCARRNLSGMPTRLDDLEEFLGKVEKLAE